MQVILSSSLVFLIKSTWENMNGNDYWPHCVSSRIAAVFSDFALLRLELEDFLLHCLPMNYLVSFFFLFSLLFSFYGFIPETIFQWRSDFFFTQCVTSPLQIFPAHQWKHKKECAVIRFYNERPELCKWSQFDEKNCADKIWQRHTNQTSCYFQIMLLHMLQWWLDLYPPENWFPMWIQSL